jgi:hypothetical protein
LTGLLLRQPLGRKFAEFIVNQRQQLLRGGWVALLDGRQDAGNFTHSDQCTALDVACLILSGRRLARVGFIAL